MIASILEAILRQIFEKHPSIYLTVQQEQPIPPLALVAAAQNANETMTTPKHKGTLS